MPVVPLHPAGGTDGILHGIHGPTFSPVLVIHASFLSFLFFFLSLSFFFFLSLFFFFLSLFFFFFLSLFFFFFFSLFSVVVMRCDVVML